MEYSHSTQDKKNIFMETFFTIDPNLLFSTWDWVRVLISRKEKRKKEFPEERNVFIQWHRWIIPNPFIDCIHKKEPKTSKIIQVVIYFWH